LASHMRTHTGEKLTLVKHECDVCKKKLS
jgi:hypothetical protein